MLRCKEGDLAVVIREEPGCEINVGRTVTVSGPVKVHDQSGPTWLIQPTHAGEWAVFRRAAGSVVFEHPPLCMVEHPDRWLMPLRPPESDEAATIQEGQPAPEILGM